MSLWNSFDAIRLCFLCVVVHTCQDFKNFNPGNGYLELMNSPNLKAWGRQQLRVTFRMDKKPGDRIRVIQESPTHEVIFESLVSTVEYIDTNKTNKKNHKYSVEYLRRDGTVVDKSVLADWAGWMYCMHEYIGSRSIGKVFFPGTHNSGSYMVPKVLHTVSPTTLANKYIYTQDESVEDQLIRGARYLDLRIGHYPNRFPISISKEIWWINHDIIKIRPLITVINQIKSFLSRWPHEIIIIDLHRFPVGFKVRSTHDELAMFLKREFGSLLHQVDHDQAWSITFNELWKTKSRILLSYNDANIAAKYRFYPPVRQLWADADSSNKLMDYIKIHLPRTCSVNQMTAVMAQLTPRASGIIKNKYGGLRGMAHFVNADIAHLFATGPWGDTAQAVAVDYLSSSGIVSAAIIQNYKRSQASHICY